MGKLLHAALSHFGIHIRLTGGKRVTQHICEWNWPDCMALIVLENLLHMAPCTTETSDDQETVCQENNDSNLLHRIAQDIIIIAVGIPKVIWL